MGELLPNFFCVLTVYNGEGKKQRRWTMTREERELAENEIGACLDRAHSHIKAALKADASLDEMAEKTAQAHEQLVKAQALREFVYETQAK